MKRHLLLSGALLCALAAGAMTPLTADELARIKVQINNNADGTFSMSATTGIEYPDASNPSLINIQNFNGEGLPLRLNVNWEDGTVYCAPYTFSSGYDEDTYQTYYLMVVSEAAAKLSSPMDSQFTSSRVTGTISADKLTLAAWNIVKVPQTFASMTPQYTQSQHTEILVPNATMTVQLREVDWDAENDDYIYPIKDGEQMSYGIYVKASPEKVLVYNWDDLPSCVELTPVKTNGVYTYTTSDTDIIYDQGKRKYGLYSADPQTDEDISTCEKTALVSAPVTDLKQLDFGKWMIYSSLRDTNRSMGAWARIALDEPLPLTAVGIDQITDARPASSAFYTLQGVRVAEPEKGLYIRIDTYADGTVKASRLAK